MRKAMLPVFCAALLVVGAAPASPAGEGPVQVEFVSPDKFTDARLNDGLRKGTSQAVIDGLAHYLGTRAPSHLEPGQVLHLEFTDVDLAGDYEPTTNISLMDVRIIKSVYPPRLEFRWELKDAEGGTLRAGEENIRDLGFQVHAAPRDQDPLRYEKRMLKRWLQDTFPRQS